MAVVEYALPGCVLTANENFLALFGYRLAEVQGQRHALFCCPREAQTPAYADFWTRLRRGDTPPTKEAGVGNWSNG